MGSKKYFDNYCGSYKIISLGPKRLLKTQDFEKKAIFPVNKGFRPTFASYYGAWQASGNNL